MSFSCLLEQGWIPALAEIIEDGKTGRLFPPDDVQSLASIIGELIEDNNQRESLGMAAKEWIEAERTWAHVVKKVAELYESC